MNLLLIGALIPGSYHFGIFSGALSKQFYIFGLQDDEEHPYDTLKPKERRSRSLRGSSVTSQPRVSISSAEVPRKSITGRRGTGAGVYYSQVPRDDDMDEVVLLQDEQHHEEQEGGVSNPTVVDSNKIYSSRMGSIIPGHHPVIPPIHTIEEEDEDLVDEAEADVETLVETKI